MKLLLLNKQFKEGPLLFYDGYCKLCNASVNFILKHDKKKVFHFAFTGQEYPIDSLLEYNNIILENNTLVLLYRDKMYTRSSAVLHVFSLLGGGFALMSVFFIIPKPVRDWIYNIIARNRFSWFGRYEHCILPDENLKQRFVDAGLPPSPDKKL